MTYESTTPFRIIQGFGTPPGPAPTDDECDMRMGSPVDTKFSAAAAKSATAGGGGAPSATPVVGMGKGKGTGAGADAEPTALSAFRTVVPDSISPLPPRPSLVADPAPAAAAVDMVLASPTRAAPVAAGAAVSHFSPVGTRAAAAAAAASPGEGAAPASPAFLRRSLTFGDCDDDDAMPLASPLAPPPPPSSAAMVLSPQRAESPVTAMVRQRPRSRTLSRNVSRSLATIGGEPARPAPLAVRASANRPPLAPPRGGASLKRGRGRAASGSAAMMSASTSSLPKSVLAAARSSSVTPPLDDYKPLLPTLDMGPAAAFNMISPATLLDVMDGKHADVVKQLFVIDCRFPFEFRGGHIDGALNLHTNDLLEEFFMANPMTSITPTIVFHCEFSSKRGPTKYKHLRGLDRLINVKRYPAVFYPEIYVLQGGYKAFYTLYSPRCVPQAYVSMFDAGAEEERNNHMVSLRRTYKRSRSFSDVSRFMSHAASSDDDDAPSAALPRAAPAAPSSASPSASPPDSPFFPSRRVISPNFDSYSDDDSGSDSDDSDFATDSPTSRPRQRQRTLSTLSLRHSGRAQSMANLHVRRPFFADSDSE